MTTRIQRACAQLIERHGSLRKAAQVLGIDHTYLQRLRAGTRRNPSPALLASLGLKQRVRYELRQ